MPKPEKFSMLGMYGKKDIFEKRVREGYTEVAFGRGEWCPGTLVNFRIVGLWSFYHTDGRIATYEHPKQEFDSHTSHGKPFEAEYTPQEFQDYIKRLRIQLSSKSSLKDLVDQWEN